VGRRLSVRRVLRPRCKVLQSHDDDHVSSDTFLILSTAVYQLFSHLPSSFPFDPTAIFSWLSLRRCYIFFNFQRRQYPPSTCPRPIQPPLGAPAAQMIPLNFTDTALLSQQPSYSLHSSSVPRPSTYSRLQENEPSTLSPLSSEESVC
jgi:hypothetical protein